MSATGEVSLYRPLQITFFYSEKNTIKIFTMTWNKIQVHILLIFCKEQAY